MAAKKIFISYSRRDTEYVSSLVEALRKQGFEVWFDKNIRTGTDWDDTIESELKKADAIVLILSQTSVASENVKDEISYAIGLDKPVNPIKIEECDVPMRLARKQFVDFTAMGHEAGFERLVNDLKQTLKLAEENKSVPKGSFKPPIANINSVPQKKSKKIVPYLIGGLITIVLFIILILNFTDDSSTDQINNSNETVVQQQTKNSDSQNEINGLNLKKVVYTKDGEKPAGYFENVGDNVWMERSVENDAKYRFIETKRDEWFVYLSDDSRDINLYIDLYRNGIYMSTTEGEEPILWYAIIATE
ncbi:TIR domain-containing protein [Aequorivita sublithincola DSM 14238]|uniref:TIR domain-containing protein n=1 Tax=Aequorivita sublithincola (strain DSM 14238 / LMG 21431 / ACAM 643 / 9-3) TaxID=746697 RepID=I3YYS8_AEQSU|nr:toll/interleukin-1 receptor domain-containing protein [Aequorivita sublithincola]AFL82146.1 TIR domain-containing protein [Aequorivita sublithincola DSM 14238]